MLIWFLCANRFNQVKYSRDPSNPTKCKFRLLMVSSLQVLTTVDFPCFSFKICFFYYAMSGIRLVIEILFFCCSRWNVLMLVSLVINLIWTYFCWVFAAAKAMGHDLRVHFKVRYRHSRFYSKSKKMLGKFYLIKTLKKMHQRSLF